jgi:hypothetical protein
LEQQQMADVLAKLDDRPTDAQIAAAINAERE